jgi:hypothetical protein
MIMMNSDSVIKGQLYNDQLSIQSLHSILMAIMAEYAEASVKTND